MKISQVWPVLAVTWMLSACSDAAPPQVLVTGSWARETPPGANVGAAYLELENVGSAADSLIALEAPPAGRVEVHSMTMKDGMMKMNKLEQLPLPAKGKVALKPGGLHLMLMDLNAPLVAGQSFPLKLKFQHAPEVTVTVTVQPVGAGSSHAGH